MIQKIFLSLWGLNQKQVVYEQLKPVSPRFKKKKKATNKTKKHLYSSINNFDQKKNIKKKEMEKENPVYLGYIWKTPQFSFKSYNKTCFNINNFCWVFGTLFLKKLTLYSRHA